MWGLRLHKNMELEEQIRQGNLGLQRGRRQMFDKQIFAGPPLSGTR